MEPNQSGDTMKSFASQGHKLQLRLSELTLRVREIRALMLVDRDGLVLVSTLHARNLEESLAAVAAFLHGQMERARDDFQMGPLRYLHIAGRDRQILVTPVNAAVALVAAADPTAHATDLVIQLLATAREILEEVHAAAGPGEGA